MDYRADYIDDNGKPCCFHCGFEGGELEYNDGEYTRCDCGPLVDAPSGAECWSCREADAEYREIMAAGYDQHDPDNAKLVL